jgi:hypothetical protein
MYILLTIRGEKYAIVNVVSTHDLLSQSLLQED